MSFKRCFKCLIELPLSAFYKHARMGDGHLNKCIDCTKKDVSANRLANIGRVRAYDRARASAPHRIAKNAAIAARWRSQFPGRRKAQVIVGNAVRCGKLKPEPCFICGEKAEAHHPDYNHPLDVVWLCSAHHKQAHALGRKLAA